MPESISWGLETLSEATTASPEVRAAPDDELDLRLLRGRDGSGGLVVRLRVLPTALLLTALHLLVVVWRLCRGWFWQDDFNILATAARRPLSPGLLFSNYNGHLIPGSWVLAWVFDRIAPMQWWPAAVVTVVFVAATDLVMLALLRRLFGLRPAVLLPYAIFLFTSLTLTSTLWWAASLEWLPVTLSLVLALWCHVGYLRSGSRWWAAGAILSVAFGLAFFEKALTTTVVLAAFTVGWSVPGPLWRRPWRAVAGHWRYWLAHAALAGGFLWLYFARVTIDTGPDSRSQDAVEVTRLMIFDTLLPSLVGGPLHWLVSNSGISAFPEPGDWLVVIAVLLTLAAVGGSLVFVRGAWRAWVLLALFLAMSVFLVITARLGFIGPIIGRDHRYLTDLAVMAPLCLALAWLPLRDGLDVALDSRPAEVTTSTRGQRAAERRRVGGAWLADRGPRMAGLATLAIVIVVAGGIVSGEGFMKSWTRNPSQAYMTTLQSDLKTHHGPVYLFGDEVPPDTMMEPTFLTSRTLGRITRPLKVRPVIGNAVPAINVVDPHGHIHNGTIKGTDAVLFGPVCATTAKPAVITLPTALPPGHWKLRLGYFANRQTDAKVSVGANPATSMRLDRGLNTEYISLYAGHSAQITVAGLDQAASVCVGSATLGLPIATN